MPAASATLAAQPSAWPTRERRAGASPMRSSSACRTRAGGASRRSAAARARASWYSTMARSHSVQPAARWAAKRLASSPSSAPRTCPATSSSSGSCSLPRRGDEHLFPSTNRAHPVDSPAPRPHRPPRLGGAPPGVVLAVLDPAQEERGGRGGIVEPLADGREGFARDEAVERLLFHWVHRGVKDDEALTPHTERAARGGERRGRVGPQAMHGPGGHQVCAG